MNRTDKKMKELFNKIGLEQPSANFTSMIMDKIGLEYKPVPVKKSIFRGYGFMLSYIAAILILIPLVIPVIRHLIRVDIHLVDIDFSAIREWFNQILALFSQINLSTSIIISIACSLMIGIFAFNSFMDLRKKTINFS